MKAMLRALTQILKRERGFTLVEMVTVVAIMGVMAAVAVPMVNSQLGKTREQSYRQDFALIQTSVDSFFTAADNVRFLGQRQLPIVGASNSTFYTTNTGITRSSSTKLFNVVATTNPSNDPPTPIQSPTNPLRGTRGGNPKWRDGGTVVSGTTRTAGTADSNRELVDSTGLPDYTTGSGTTGGEEDLHNPFDTFANAGFGTTPTPGGWYVDKVKFQDEFYAVDTRDYFIDFDLLVKAGFLQKVPESASPDTGGGTVKGSYSWYVRADGAVESLFYFLPSNSDAFVDIDVPSGTPVPAPLDDGTLDVRGFFDGVYP